MWEKHLLERLENFREAKTKEIETVWQELSAVQRREGEEILLRAWQEEEEAGGDAYSDYQILANFLSSQILFPCHDAIFKAIFLSDKEFTLLKDFLTNVLFLGKRKVETIEPQMTEIPVSNFAEKATFTGVCISQRLASIFWNSHR